MQIVVLGAHRSGTSAVTRLINMMGAYFDSGHASIGFNEENPKGFWERSDVIALNDRLLAYHSSSWDQLAHWPQADPEKADDRPAALHDIKRLVLDLDAHRPWVMKDPRLCLTFVEWKPLLELPVAVIVYRDPLEVATSMATRNGFAVCHGLAIWEYYTVELLNAVRGLPCVFVEHRKLLEQPAATAEALYRGLVAEGVQGLRMPAEKEVAAFIEPALYRAKSGAFHFDDSLTPHQQRLCALLRGEEPFPAAPLEVSTLSLDIMRLVESKATAAKQWAKEKVRLAVEATEAAAEAAARATEAAAEAAAREENIRQTLRHDAEQAQARFESAWQLRLDSKQAELDAARDMDEEHRRTIHQCHNVAAEQEDRLRNAAEENEKLTRRNSDLQRALAEREHELLQLRASTSWKTGSALVRILTFWKRSSSRD